MSLTSFAEAMAYAARADVPATDKAIVMIAAATAIYDLDNREMWIGASTLRRIESALYQDLNGCGWDEVRGALERFADDTGIDFQLGHDPDDPDPEIFGPDRSESETAAAIRDHLAQFRGTVYLMQCGSRYKIGITSNLERRLKQIGRQAPFPITIVHQVQVEHALAAESALHKLFAHQRVHGEWFEFFPKQVNQVIAAMNERAGAGV